MSERIRVVDGRHVTGDDGPDDRVRLLIAAQDELQDAIDEMAGRYDVGIILNALLCVFANVAARHGEPDLHRRVIARLPEMFEATLLVHQAHAGGKQ